MWVPEQIKHAILLEVKRTKLRPPYIGHIMKGYGPLKKTLRLGNIEGRRKRGRPNMRRTDSINTP